MHHRRHILITLQPGEGHLPPFRQLSRALRDAGHAVTFATSPAFVPRLRAAGEQAVGVGLDWKLSDGPAGTADVERPRTLFQRLFLGEVATRMADDLCAVVDTHRPDVIVRDPVEFAGAAVAAARGIPLATFELTFPLDHEVLTTSGDLPDDGELQALRRQVGLGDSTDPDWFLGTLQLGTLPPGYVAAAGYAHAATPRGTRVTIAAHRPDPTVVPPMPGWVDDLEAATYVSLGTVFAGAFPGVLTAAGLGAAQVGAPPVVTCGNAPVPAALRAVAGPKVHVSRFLPQDPVLRRCAAAVVHGGTGTTLAALTHGVPLVLIPLGADQPAHARLVAARGAGIVLRRDEVDAQTVAAALRRVREEPTFRQAAVELGRELAALPGPQHAVEAIEALAAGRGPATDRGPAVSA